MKCCNDEEKKSGTEIRIICPTFFASPHHHRRRLIVVENPSLKSIYRERRGKTSFPQFVKVSSKRQKIARLRLIQKVLMTFGKGN